MMGYLAATADFGLPLVADKNLRAASIFVDAASDSDHAGCPDTARSTSGWVVALRSRVPGLEEENTKAQAHLDKVFNGEAPAPRVAARAEARELKKQLQTERRGQQQREKVIMDQLRSLRGSARSGGDGRQNG